MNTIFLIAIAIAGAVAVAALLAEIAHLIRMDGHGLRSSSGLPRDWAPPELPSTPYNVKRHF
ncbi:MAG: hypothetical protein H0U28_11060 [Nocardioidaceae bacterium]|nr:hypothetical protein [Nocardioidaceae bacterium]